MLNNNIRLDIVLTCWDEMESQEKPYEVLKSKLPLLLSFLESNWHEDYLKIIGLSTQGFNLANINKNIGIRTHYDNDMGLGLGLSQNY